MYSYRGVFIAQRLTYPLATIPILPPNCPKYRIFHGLFGNIKHADSMDYRWPDMWVLVLFQILRRPTSSIRASGPGLRRASSPLLFRLISIHPCIFTSGPSLGYLRDFAGRESSAATACGVFAEATSIRGLRFGVFAGALSRIDVFAPRRRWLPQQQPLEASAAPWGIRRLDHPVRGTQP